MTIARRQISITGRVQGVGFRPFVHRTATRLGLAGVVRNVPRGVEIDAEGEEERLLELIDHLTKRAPPRAVIANIKIDAAEPRGAVGFSIQESDRGETRGAEAPVDVATCAECLSELFDSRNRRFGYAFIACAACGPRFTLAEALPFDRLSTTMRDFPPCRDCLAEHDASGDLRFHAQTISCPACGPRLALLGPTLARGSTDDADVIGSAVSALRRGEILGIKGDGGFLFFADAARIEAVGRLRRRKDRPAKPFALLMPSLASIRAHCHLGPAEEAALTSSAAPIVLLRKKADTGSQEICAEIAPVSPFFGCMLPSSPLHHLLMRGFGGPLIATSGNRRGEPIAKDEAELSRLVGIADLFITHNRRIVHRADDSLVRVIDGRPVVMRLGRGMAPLVLPLTPPRERSALGIGAQEKAAFATAHLGQIVLSQQLGDLDMASTAHALESEIGSFAALYGHATPELCVSDLHPDYESTRLAEARSATRGQKVQHHHAHVLACIAENNVCEPVLGVAWDGSGFGSDGTVWGGELLLVDGLAMRRAGHLKTFPLPGGEAAVREPRRAALGALYELERTHGDRDTRRAVDRWLARHFERAELAALRASLAAHLNAPMTSSAGRLFDAVAALVGACQKASYRDEAPVALEALAAGTTEAFDYGLELAEGPDGELILDWRAMLRAMLPDLANHGGSAPIARGFHVAMARAIGAAAERIGKANVVLTGGVFQNALLTTLATAQLQARGFRVHRHARVPPGDGGIAVGQALYGVLHAEKKD